MFAGTERGVGETDEASLLDIHTSIEASILHLGNTIMSTESSREQRSNVAVRICRAAIISMQPNDGPRLITSTSKVTSHERLLDSLEHRRAEKEPCARKGSHGMPRSNCCCAAIRIFCALLSTSVCVHHGAPAPCNDPRDEVSSKTRSSPLDR